MDRQIRVVPGYVAEETVYKDMEEEKTADHGNWKEETMYLEHERGETVYLDHEYIETEDQNNGKEETVYLDHEEEENLYMEHENEKTLEEDTVDQDDVEKEIASQEICVCQTEQVCFITFAFFPAVKLFFRCRRRKILTFCWSFERNLKMQ